MQFIGLKNSTPFVKVTFIESLYTCLGKTKNLHCPHPVIISAFFLIKQGFKKHLKQIYLRDMQQLS